MAAGTITFDHARVLVNAANPLVIDQLDGLHVALIERAADRPLAIWRSELLALVELLDGDGPFDPDRELARNRLHLSEPAPGEVLFSGVLVGEEALVFTDAVRTGADRLWRRFVADHTETPELPIPARATIDALAMVDVIRQGLTVTSDPATSRAPVTDITLVIHADDIHADNPDPDNPAGADLEGADRPAGLFTIDGARLPAERYAHLFCDAVYIQLVVDRVGVPLNMGRSARYATPAQRRALIIRDGGCTFPGCDAPGIRCDAHHVDHWHRHGRTDLAKLALLCRHHHRVTHRPNWTMTATADHRFTWTTPTGRTLHSQRHHGRPTNTWPDP